MARRPRESAAGLAYHVLNRGVARMTVFEKPEDYAAFERVIDEAVRRTGMRLLSYCLMPNHWHLVVWPAKAGELSEFMRWLTVTHTQRWHAHHHTAGTGPVYQGRFKSFPIEADGHLLAVCRYVERNAMRAGLVAEAQMWRWSSLWRHRNGDEASRAILSEWPVPGGRPSDWLRRVNRPESAMELDSLRRSVVRGQPFGSEKWVTQTAKRLSLESTLRPRGRPRKEKRA